MCVIISSPLVDELLHHAFAAHRKAPRLLDMKAVLGFQAKAATVHDHILKAILPDESLNLGVLPVVIVRGQLEQDAGIHHCTPLE